MMFWPSAATWASTWALAPLPMLTMVMTAPTPMMMPSAVRIDRMVLRRRARRATRMTLVKRMAGASVLCGDEFCGGLGVAELGHFLLGDTAVLDQLVAHDDAVAQDE